MNYEEFISYIRDSIAKEVGNNKTVTLNKVLKNNDMELDALTINSRETNISPTIYLNSYFKEYESGRSPGDIVSEIYQLYESHRDKLEFDVDMFKNFDGIKDRIAYKLINKKANERLLSQVPFIEILDLAIVFYCLVDNDFLGSATALIHNVHMEMWEVTVEDLYNTARKNTPRILPYHLRDMNDVIKDILVSDIENTIYENDFRYDENCKIPMPEVVAEGLLKGIREAEDAVEMYVLTNKQKINGAACILYDRVLNNFASQREKDLYILPSSIHEVILVPVTNDIDREELCKMVYDVNHNELEEGDVLSDYVYYYDRIKDEILI